jgi:hypothetical protein
VPRALFRDYKPLIERKLEPFKTIKAKWREPNAFVLDGELTVETRAPDDCRALGVGKRYRVNAGHVHQTSNRGTRDCRFLIVQGVGKYDFKGLAVAQDEETRTAGV